VTGREKRKAVRLPGRFAVQVREKLATWATSTEDVSHRGCRIAMKRPLQQGALVELAFDMGPQVEPLVVHGQVAWVQRAARAAGVTFLSAPRQRQAAEERPASWIERLRAAARREADAGGDAEPLPA
jgi:hypothetical protein